MKQRNKQRNRDKQTIKQTLKYREETGGFQRGGGERDGIDKGN